MIKPIIMAGGKGSRLWPLSRASRPKQFLSLNSNKTMLQNTIQRLEELNTVPGITICNEEHRFFVAEQLKEINCQYSIVLEPEGRNTAPAVALAAMLSDSDSLLLVLSADHIITDTSAFINAINMAIPLAEAGKLVTFGIKPDSPQTGYGYIKKGKKLQAGFHLEKFVEKPSLDTANNYIKSDKYLWNSGIFLFKASQYLEELEKFCPDIYRTCRGSIKSSVVDLDFIRPDNQRFLACPSESIDYAVMEKTENAAVIEMDVGWSDIGSWSSLWAISEKDQQGNTIYGDALIRDTNDSFIYSEDRLVSTLGLNNTIIVSTKDSVLVANMESSEDTKFITDKLKKMNRNEWEFDREVFRPWGKYDSVDSGERYQVKRITVNPGAKLSLQKHHKRSEHWVVVSGSAKVTNGDKTFLLEENQSTFIPAGVVHSLENPTDSKLELIEVQSGSYLGEDDIVRYEDIYGRIK